MKLEIEIKHSRARAKILLVLLMKRNDMDIENVPYMVTACCILHNMCVIHGDAFNELWVEAMNNSTQPATSMGDNTSSSIAQAIRNALVDYYK